MKNVFIKTVAFMLAVVGLFVINIFSPHFFLSYSTAGILMYSFTGDFRVSLLAILVCYISMFLASVFGLLLSAANGNKITLPKGRLDLREDNKNE